MLMGHWVKFCLVIGWGLILEYAMGSWSPFHGQDILIKCSKCLDTRLTTDPASYTVIFNELTRFLIVILVISLLIKGTEKAASANNIVILKVSAVIFVLLVL
jgi:APA family basic amino acid/polyamine antiporter